MMDAVAALPPCVIVAGTAKKTTFAWQEFAPAAELEFAGHAKHEDLPATDQEFAAQGVHALAPATEYVPAAHDVHVLAPAAL
jgi:hypothetical protein